VSIVADASTASAPHAGLTGGLRNVAMFLMALCTVCAALYRPRPLSDVTGIYRKYVHVAEHRADYDALFVGSSRFHHGIIPPRFDARVAALSGARIHSFNFGHDAMWPPESYYMLRQLLALHPPRLRWVLIDCTAIHTEIDERLTLTKRFAYWHDARHTALAWGAIAEEPLPWSDRLRRWSGHAAPLVRNWTNTGTGAERLGLRLGGLKRKKQPREMSPRAWAATEGYEPEPDVAMSGDTLEAFLGAVADFRTNLPPQPIAPMFRRALEEIIADVRAAGARPVLILTPTVKEKENFTGLPEGVPVFRFQDPNEFPQLFDPANCYDTEHLNHAGAQIFTDLLATGFAELAKANP
jgi:hypothetical protein